LLSVVEMENCASWQLEIDNNSSYLLCTKSGTGRRLVTHNLRVIICATLLKIFT
jgi:hypothetical protein